MRDTASASDRRSADADDARLPKPDACTVDDDLSLNEERPQSSVT